MGIADGLSYMEGAEVTILSNFRSRLRSGTAPALAMTLTARAFGVTTRLAGRLIADQRRKARAPEKAKATVCLECGQRQAEIDGRCRSCSVCVAGPRA